MYNAPILKKAIDILKLLVKEYEPLGVAEIARRVSISKSTAYGILQSFCEEGLITKDAATKKYTIGKEMMRLSKLVFKGQDLISVARPFLERVVELVDETVFLGIREYNAIKVIDVIEAKKDLKISSPVGTKLPITAGAAGKIFLSTMSNEKILAYVSEKGLPQYTERSITDVNVFLEEIEKTRHLGYSVDMEEYLKGIRAVATLIRQEEKPIGAIWFVGFSNSMLDERLNYVIRNLQQTAGQISNRISLGMATERITDNLQNSNCSVVTLES
jgi:IclR family transcriptional regulator, KDG regulon repressor